MPDDVDQVEPIEDPADLVEIVAPSLPRETPVFVSDPPPLSTEAEVGSDEFGRPLETIKAESIEAASHWDRRAWHRR